MFYMNFTKWPKEFDNRPHNIANTARRSISVGRFNGICRVTFFRQSESKPQTASRSVQPFCTAHGRASLYFTMGRSFPLKIAAFHGGSGPSSNTWFLGPIQVLNPNGISIGSAVFAGRTTVTNRQTDIQTDRPRYSIYNNRPHLRM